MPSEDSQESPAILKDRLIKKEELASGDDYDPYARLMLLHALNDETMRLVKLFPHGKHPRVDNAFNVWMDEKDTFAYLRRHRLRETLERELNRQVSHTEVFQSCVQVTLIAASTSTSPLLRLKKLKDKVEHFRTPQRRRREKEEEVSNVHRHLRQMQWKNLPRQTHTQTQVSSPPVTPRMSTTTPSSPRTSRFINPPPHEVALWVPVTPQDQAEEDRWCHAAYKHVLYGGGDHEFPDLLDYLRTCLGTFWAT